MNILRSTYQLASLWGPIYTCSAFIDKIFGCTLAGSFQDNALKHMTQEECLRKIEKLYQQRTGENLDINHPKNFNQKIQWLKLYDTTPLKTRLADKYLVREWIKEQIGEKYLIPLLGMWDRFDQIAFDQLPNSFFLKCNHGHGCNLGVRNKNGMNMGAAKKSFDHWMKCNFAFYGFELQYCNIPRKIIAEKYIEQSDGNLLDYKIHVFHGIPRIIEVIGDRDLVRHKGKECFVNVQWKPQNVRYYNYDEYDYVPPKPANLDEMLVIARTLGKDFKYVRVDLYNIDGKILFGEMSFTPSSGYGKEENQVLEGSWIHLE